MILRCKIKNLISEKLRSLVFVVGMLSAQFGYSQINVVASPDHLKIDGIDALGNFFLNVTGGTSPYTYTWVPGSLSSKDYTNATIGAYTLNVVDNASNTATYKYNLGYKSTWTNFYNCISRNDSLIPNSTGGVSRSAISKNVLRPNTDGWMEMIYYPEFDLNVIGLVDTAMVANQGDWYDYDIAVHVSGGYLYATEGVNWYYLGPISYGDVVRIERTSNVFYVRQNNTVMFTLGGINQNMQVKGLFGSGGLINIGTSFSDTTKLYPLKLAVSLDHVKTDDVDSLGNIYLGISGGIAPYTVNWAPNNVSSQNNLNIPKGSYTATVIDSNNDTLIYSCSLGYKTDWTNFYGSMSRNDSLMSNNSSGYVNRSAVSNNILRPNVNGWVEMIVKPVNIPCVMGLLDSMIVANQGDNYDIDIGVHVTYGNAFYVWTGGWWNYIGTANNGDILRIERTSNVFYVKQNGSVVYSQGGINKSLKVKGLIYYSSLVEIGVSFKDSTSTQPLKAIAMIDHITPNGIDSTGNISLKVSGGASPYTYRWSPGNVASKNIFELEAGTYTLNIKDYAGDSLKYVYNLGYKAKWSNFYGTATRNDSIYLNGTIPAGFPTARTRNELSANSNGWAEIVVQPFVSPYVVGFLDSASVQTPAFCYDMDFGLHLSYGNTLYAWYNSSWYYCGNAYDGDAIAIFRDGTEFIMTKNGVSVFSASSTTNKKLKLKVQLIEAPLVNIATSFGVPFKVTISKNHADFFNEENGSAQIFVEGGLPPYDVLWYDSLRTGYRDNLGAGTYSFVVTDSLVQNTIGKSFLIGIKPYWSFKKNVTSTEDSLFVTNMDSLGFVIAENIINSYKDAQFEMNINNTNLDFSFGFIGTSNNLSFSDSAKADSVRIIRLGLLKSLVHNAIVDSLNYNGTNYLSLPSEYSNIHLIRVHNGFIQLLLNGSPRTSVFSYAPFDKVVVGRSPSGLIYITRNDTVMYTHNLDIRSQYLYPTIITHGNSYASKKAIVGNPNNPVVIGPSTNLNMYAALKPKYDGGYYSTINKTTLLFKLFGEYNNTIIKYKVYNRQNLVVMTNGNPNVINSTLQNLGDNRYSLNVSNLTTGTYVLEATNEKNEKTVLRFKHVGSNMTTGPVDNGPGGSGSGGN